MHFFLPAEQFEITGRKITATKEKNLRSVLKINSLTNKSKMFLEQFSILFKVKVNKKNVLLTSAQKYFQPNKK